MVQTWIEALEERGYDSVARTGIDSSREMSTSELCPLVCRHPVEKPRIGLIVSSDLEVDQHAAAQHISAMLDAFLSYACAGGKRCETEALLRRLTHHQSRAPCGTPTAVKKGLPVSWE